MAALWQGLQVATAPAARRIGAADSKTRSQLLDAAEDLLLEEGYASVTSRRVGARAGLKPQLVHYYFRSMDELFVEMFRRRADRDLARMSVVIASDPSLRTLWRIHSDQRGAAFIIEFAALANHRKAIRAEVARYAERFRAAQLEAVSAALAESGAADHQLPPIVALLMMTGLSQVLALEQALGITLGHEETEHFVEQALVQMGRRRSVVGAARTRR